MVKQISHGFNKKDENQRWPTQTAGHNGQHPGAIVASWRARIWPLLSCTRRGRRQRLVMRVNGHVTSRFQRGFPFCPLGFVFVVLISYLFLISGSIGQTNVGQHSPHRCCPKSAGKFKLCNSCFSNQSKRLQRISSLLWKRMAVTRVDWNNVFTVHEKT